MYNVYVTKKVGFFYEAVDERSFAFGTWQEIGLYLDLYGYNDPEYKVHITFSA